MHCCRIVGGIKNKNIRNSLGAKWNASHLAEGLCALRHWKRVSMPPTTQSLRHPLTRAVLFAPRIKTARRFTAKKPLMVKNFLEGGCIKSLKWFCMVGTRYFASASNDWYSIWYYSYSGREVSRPYHSPATLAKPNFRKTSPKSTKICDFGEVLRNIWGNCALDSLIFLACLTLFSVKRCFYYWGNYYICTVI